MVLKKLISVLLVTALLFIPVARVTASNATASNVSLNIVHVNEHVAVYGAKDSEKLYNFFVDTAEGIVQFAAVYSDNPDYMYEYIFYLPEAADISSDLFWNDLIDSCFANKSKWNVMYLPNVVQISEPAQVTDDIALNSSPLAADDNIAYFEDWLKSKYGEEYTYYLRSSTINGVSMTQNEQLQHYVYKDRTYEVIFTISVVSFITGILGMIVSPGILSTISFIAGVGGMIYAGTKVYEYTLRANWFRYVTVGGGSYPYSMADKFTFHTAYVSSTTGGRMVDPESTETMYFPSRSYYLDYNLQFNDAYYEYLRIGWQG